MKNILLFGVSGVVLAMSALAQGQSVSVMLAPNPPKMGKQNVEVHVKDDKGNASKDVTVEGQAVMPATPDMGEMKSQLKLEKTAAGVFVGKFNISMDGTWYVAVKVFSGKVKKDYYYKLSTGVKDVVSVKEIPK